MNEDLKGAVKEAAKEWLNEQMAVFGRWTVKTLASLILVAFIVFAVKYGK